MIELDNKSIAAEIGCVTALHAYFDCGHQLGISADWGYVSHAARVPINGDIPQARNRCIAELRAWHTGYVRGREEAGEVVGG